MGLGQLPEVCQVLEKVALKQSSKSTKHELDLVHGFSWTFHTPLPLGLTSNRSGSSNSSGTTAATTATT